MAYRVFIDGEAGTTGLQIRERLAPRCEIELLSLSDGDRKDPYARREALNNVDLAILCLPDAAAIEAVSMIENPDVRVIDASTAHRVAPGWDYGFAEMTSGQAERIAKSHRVANVGCYATASIALLRPLVEAGLLAREHPISINAISGYSGGGKKLIEAFENPNSSEYDKRPFWLYALKLAHKHVPEIQAYSQLEKPPLFVPSVGRFAQGMLVSIPLQLWSLPGQPTPSDVQTALEAHYDGARFVEVARLSETEAMEKLDPEGLNGTNDMRLHVFGDTEKGQAVLVGLLDNLGKGASGAAVQNLNLMLGLDESIGLESRHAA